MDAQEIALPGGRLRTVVIHMEMRAPPPDPPPEPPRGDVALRHGPAMDIAAYRALHAAVGERWLWWERLALDDAALATLLAAPETEIHLLEVDGTVAGFGELGRLPTSVVELRYCGLTPPHIGCGLGTYLLLHVLDRAWRTTTKRVVLNTCNLDHPGAPAFYRKHGFRETHRETRIIPDPRVAGLLPPTAGPHIPLAEE